MKTFIYYILIATIACSISYEMVKAKQQKIVNMERKEALERLILKYAQGKKDTGMNFDRR